MCKPDYCKELDYHLQRVVITNGDRNSWSNSFLNGLCCQRKWSTSSFSSSFDCTWALLTSAKNQPPPRFNKGQTALSKTTCGNQLHISLAPLQMNDESREDMILIYCVACLSKSKGCLTAGIPQGFYTHHMWHFQETAAIAEIQN